MYGANYNAIIVIRSLRYGEFGGLSSLLRVPFSDFRPVGATRCTDECEIWQEIA